jgi:hypothetical protein
LLDEACRRPTSEERVAALLDITVCDPACGSGHFLVAAARRIAKRVAAEETGEPEPPVTVIRAALRRVTSRCIYGVDLNPMAAELARVALCLEALEPGKPLAFLDQNIRVGNSLLGTTPALLAKGLPDAAFTPIEGDDKKVATALRKQNAAEQSGQHDLFSPAGIPVSNTVLARRAQEIVRELPESLEDLHIHQQRQALELAASAELRQQKLLADAWCAAFAQPKTDESRRTAITQATLEAFGNDDGTLASAAAEELVTNLTRQYRFFHWHIEFPHIFRTGNEVAGIDAATGWAGGFSCVIGNPPWDQVQHDPREFFASRDPDVANAANMAERTMKLADVKRRNPALYAEHKLEQRHIAGIKHFAHMSGRFPLTSYGRLNTYALFAETSRTVISRLGRSGQIIPTGIATDSFNQYFFRDLVQRASLISLFDFRNAGFFMDIAGAQGNRFCLLTLTGGRNENRMRLAFRCESISQARDPACLVELTPEEITLLNPNSGTCPVFRSRRDANITLDVYKRIPILVRHDATIKNPWNLSFQLMFMMNTDSFRFHEYDALVAEGWALHQSVFVKDGDRMLPLCEAKMIHHFDHRFGDYRLARTVPGKGVRQLPTPSHEQHRDAFYTVLPRYWVKEADVSERLSGRWDRGWLLGWRDVASGIDERTVIPAVIPRTAVGHSFPLLLVEDSPEKVAFLEESLSSFALDFLARQKIGGTHLTFFIIEQLPVLPPATYDKPTRWSSETSLSSWLLPRALELTYTAWDLESFARDLGDNGSPFIWDGARRSRLRAEIDAAFFHLYGIDHDDVAYIMETFPIVRRKDVHSYGSFRTKELILEVYDAMAEATRTGETYQTILDPPPGYGPRHPDSSRP